MIDIIKHTFKETYLGIFLSFAFGVASIQNSETIKSTPVRHKTKRYCTYKLYTSEESKGVTV